MQTILISPQKVQTFFKNSNRAWGYYIVWQTIPDRNNSISKRKLGKVIMHMLLCKFISNSSCYRVWTNKVTWYHVFHNTSYNHKDHNHIPTYSSIVQRWQVKVTKSLCIRKMFYTSYLFSCSHLNFINFFNICYCMRWPNLNTRQRQDRKKLEKLSTWSLTLSVSVCWFAVINCYHSSVFE